MRSVSTAAFFERLDELGLAIKQVEILRALDDRGATAIEELAGRVLLSPTEVVCATDELVARGLLERASAAVVSLAVTEAGRAVVEELGDMRQRAAERYFAEMTDLQRSRLAAALEILPRLA